jgi:hypothetical protein
MRNRPCRSFRLLAGVALLVQHEYP